MSPRSNASPLHQSAYLLCGDWHLAHDLVQETLVKAYQHWPQRGALFTRTTLSPEPCPLSTEASS